MTVSGVRRSWRRLASSSVSAFLVRVSSSRMALKLRVTSRTSLGPSSGSGAAGAPGPSTGTAAVATASRRSGPVVDRASSQASEPPTSSRTSPTNGSARSRSPSVWAAARSGVARTSPRGRTAPGSVSAMTLASRVVPSSNRMVASTNVPRPPAGTAGRASTGRAVPARLTGRASPAMNSRAMSRPFSWSPRVERALPTSTRFAPAPSCPRIVVPTA